MKSHSGTPSDNASGVDEFLARASALPLPLPMGTEALRDLYFSSVEILKDAQHEHLASVPTIDRAVTAMQHQYPALNRETALTLLEWITLSWAGW